MISLLTPLTGSPSSPSASLPPIATKYGLLSFALNKKKAAASSATPNAASPLNAILAAVNNAAKTASTSPSTGTAAMAAAAANADEQAAANGNTAAATTGTSSSSDSVNNNQSISEQGFMQLLVTQLQNQDPLNPQQPYELAAELAQFTSVSELSQLNTTVSGQATDITSNTDAVQAGLSASLIGQDVIATGNQVDVAQGAKTASFIADIGGSGGAATVTLTDANGNTAGTYQLGSVAGGRQVLSVPTNGLSAGAYTYSLNVTDSGGNSVATTTYTAGLVTGVSISSGTPSLQIGDMTAPVSSLVEVLPTANSSSSN